jgi:hypothetical protein
MGDLSVLDAEQHRLARIAEFEDTVLINTSFELVEDNSDPDQWIRLRQGR